MADSWVAVSYKQEVLLVLVIVLVRHIVLHRDMNTMKSTTFLIKEVENGLTSDISLPQFFMSARSLIPASLGAIF